MILRLKLSILLALALVSPALCCPFCNPGESDIFSDIADAQAVVLVNKIEARKYKVTENLLGGIKVGRVVVAAEPSGKLGKKGSYLLTTAGPPNLPYWSDAPRVLDERELSFARKALKVSKSKASLQWDFAAQHVQDPSSEISAAAYNLLAGAPLSEVQKRAEIVGVDKLLKWSRDIKLPAERRALYLLMVYQSLKATDLSWVKASLFDPKLAPSSALQGPLAMAYLKLTGLNGLQEIQKKFYAVDLPASRVTALNRALTLAYEQSSDSKLREAIKSLFIRELEKSQRGAFVLAPLAMWGDERPAALAEALFRKNENVTWVKVAVIRYFRSLKGAKAQQSLARLRALDPTLVDRTVDVYRRADLGID